MATDEKPISVRKAYEKLSEACYELDGLAYLIAEKGEEELVRLNHSDLHYGIGKILEGLTARVRKIALRLDALDQEQSS